MIAKKGMRKVWGAAVVVLVLAAAGLFAYFSVASNRRAFALRVEGIGPGGTPPATLEGMVKAIGTYERMIEENVALAAQAGIYSKILGTRLMEKKMYGEALEAYERAIGYFPEDFSLYYRAGLCAAIMAKSSLDFQAVGSSKQRDRYNALAEASYLRAIELSPLYARPKYSLGVLYVFELDKPALAAQLLEDYLVLERRDVDAMFVLARAYYVLGETGKAVALYDRIAATTRVAEKKAEAEANKKRIQEEGGE